MKAVAATSGGEGMEPSSWPCCLRPRLDCAQGSSRGPVKMLILGQEVWVGPEILHEESVCDVQY